MTLSPGSCVQVGHMVGLGDRHGENLLLDASTGDCVQIDFACLFDRVRLGVLLAPHRMAPSPCSACTPCI